MGLTLDDLSRRVDELAPHPTGAGRQTTKRIVRLTLAAIGEHFVTVGQRSMFGDHGHLIALKELRDACKRSLNGIRGETNRRRAAARPQTHQQGVHNAR